MKIFDSTLIRLTFWYVGVLALILLFFTSITYFLINSVLDSKTDNTLSEIALAFEKTAQGEFSDEEDKNNPAGVTDAIREATVDVGFKNYKVFVFSAGKKLVSASDNSKLRDDISAEAAAGLLGKSGGNDNTKIEYFTRDDESFKVLLTRFQVHDETFDLLIVHPLEEQETLLEKIAYVFLITVPLALIFASFGGYYLAGKSFKPIAEMSEKAEAITARNLHERLPVENEYDELGRLANTFNRLLSRLDMSFEQQKRFMADASHELRTPVAIVRGEAEVSLTKDNRGTADYRETISIMQKEAERMSKVIEDLFTLSRADAGENPVSKQSVYLEDILSDTVKSFRSIASKRGISLQINIDDEMPIFADEQLLARLFSNLLDNAIKHTKSFVKISAKIENENCIVKISDDGNGIPAEEQNRVFDRFYRVDPSRSREKTQATGSGAGLGLAISKWIAESHEGTLELISSDTNGSIFGATIPMPK